MPRNETGNYRMRRERDRIVELVIASKARLSKIIDK